MKSIVGVPRGESDAILAYLNRVIVETPELHVRFLWQEGDVAIWDNRCTNHSATYGFGPHRRHAVRVTPVGERPVFRGGGSMEEERCKRLGVERGSRDGSGESNYND